MKRGGPLRRTPMKRGGRVNPRRREPRTREAPEWTVEEWADATMVLLRRCGSRCERCNQPLGNQLERHHRQRRRDGGDRLSNLLALHTHCHQQVHAGPDESKDRGWIVPPFVADPATARVWIGAAWWLLDDDGGKTAA